MSNASNIPFDIAFSYLYCRESFLQYKYEKAMSNASNIPFDDLIFFLNEILFFGEDHKTVLWDESEHNVQHELFK